MAILNEEAEKRGVEQRFTSMSRVVKEIYDRVQEAYNGRYDEASDRWLDYRDGFFMPDEIWQIAAESLGLDKE